MQVQDQRVALDLRARPRTSAESSKYVERKKKSSRQIKGFTKALNIDVTISGKKG